MTKGLSDHLRFSEKENDYFGQFFKTNDYIRSWINIMGFNVVYYCENSDNRKLFVYDFKGGKPNLAISIFEFKNLIEVLK